MIDIGINASCHVDSVCEFPWNTAKGVLGMLLYLFAGLKWFSYGQDECMEPHGISQRLLMSIRICKLVIMAGKHQKLVYLANPGCCMFFYPRLLYRSVSSNHRRATVDDIVESVWTDRCWMAPNLSST